MPLVATEVLAAMITPAVLISASGMLTLSTTNRLGRVVDRVRELADHAEKLADPAGLPAAEVEERRDFLTAQLVALVRRLRLLQVALMLMYSAIGILVATSLSVGVRSATQLLPEWVSVALGLGGATTLFAASMVLLSEVRIAVRATLVEMAHVRATVARRTGRPVGE